MSGYSISREWNVGITPIAITSFQWYFLSQTVVEVRNMDGWGSLNHQLECSYLRLDFTNLLTIIVAHWCQIRYIQLSKTLPSDFYKATKGVEDQAILLFQPISARLRLSSQSRNILAIEIINLLTKRTETVCHRMFQILIKSLRSQ